MDLPSFVRKAVDLAAVWGRILMIVPFSLSYKENRVECSMEYEGGSLLSLQGTVRLLSLLVGVDRIFLEMGRSWGSELLDAMEEEDHH